MHFKIKSHSNRTFHVQTPKFPLVFCTFDIYEIKIHVLLRSDGKGGEQHGGVTTEGWGVWLGEQWMGKGGGDSRRRCSVSVVNTSPRFCLRSPVGGSRSLDLNSAHYDTNCSFGNFNSSLKELLFFFLFSMVLLYSKEEKQQRGKRKNNSGTRTQSIFQTRAFEPEAFQTSCY